MYILLNNLCTSLLLDFLVLGIDHWFLTVDDEDLALSPQLSPHTLQSSSFKYKNIGVLIESVIALLWLSKCFYWFRYPNMMSFSSPLNNLFPRKFFCWFFSVMSSTINCQYLLDTVEELSCPFSLISLEQVRPLSLDPRPVPWRLATPPSPALTAALLPYLDSFTILLASSFFQLLGWFCFPGPRSPFQVQLLILLT